MGGGVRGDRCCGVSGIGTGDRLGLLAAVSGLTAVRWVVRGRRGGAVVESNGLLVACVSRSVEQLNFFACADVVRSRDRWK